MMIRANNDQTRTRALQISDTHNHGIYFETLIDIWSVGFSPTISKYCLYFPVLKTWDRDGVFVDIFLIDDILQGLDSVQAGTLPLLYRLSRQSCCIHHCRQSFASRNSPRWRTRPSPQSTKRCLIWRPSKLLLVYQPNIQSGLFRYRCLHFLGRIMPLICCFWP